MKARLAKFHSAYRDPERVVLEGLHPLKHALRFKAEIEAICTPDKAALLASALAIAPDLSPCLKDRGEEVPADLYARLARHDAPAHVIAIARRPPTMIATLANLPGPLVFLENPSHLGNIGAVIRVSAAAGAAGVLTSGPADPWHPTCLRGAAGLHFALPVCKLDDPATALTGRTLVAVDPAGEPLPEARPLGAQVTIAFGTESSGLSADLRARADRVIAIPMRPGVSSLNLATSVAIVLYSHVL
ncbi:MAG: TrmH family RNA methyltransferase [Pseudomonadota bacterium]